MAHIAKYTKGVMGHMLSHYDRSKNNLNQNIHSSQTHLNYNLAKNLQPLNQLDFIHKRLSEVKVQNRADVNILCDWVITLPCDCPVEEGGQEAFFRTAYEFLKNRYGEKNVVSAYVHLDETTPHMHFAFIPVTEDRKKGGFKVSAKEVVTLTDLKTFHEDLSACMKDTFGHNISILNNATKDGNKSIEELKRQSAVELLRKTNRKATEIINTAQNKAHEIQDSIEPIQAEYEAKKAYINACDEASDISMTLPDYAQKKKNIFGKEFVTVPVEKWEEKHVSANEKQILKKATEKFEEQISSTRINQRLTEVENELTQEVNRNLRLISEVKKEKAEKERLQEEIKNLQNWVNYCEKNIPDEMEMLRRRKAEEERAEKDTINEILKRAGKKQRSEGYFIGR